MKLFANSMKNTREDSKKSEWEGRTWSSITMATSTGSFVPLTWIGRRRVFPWLQGLAPSPLIPRYPFHFSFHICLSFLWISGSVALHMHWKSSKQQCQHLSILVLSISQALGNHLIKFLGPSLAITRSAYFLDHNNRLQLCSYVSQKKICYTPIQCIICIPSLSQRLTLDRVLVTHLYCHFYPLIRAYRWISLIRASTNNEVRDKTRNISCNDCHVQPWSSIKQGYLNKVNLLQL